MTSEQDKCRHFELQRHKDVLIIRLQAFDWGVQLEIANEMLKLVEREQPTNLIIDLTVLDGAYAVLLNDLFVIYKVIAKASGKLAICLTEKVLEQFRVLRLNSFFEIHPSVEHALRSFVD